MGLLPIIVVDTVIYGIPAVMGVYPGIHGKIGMVGLIMGLTWF